MTTPSTTTPPIHATADGARVLEATTDNTSAGIARQADDVGPLQYVREYTVNAIEAVLMRGGTGVVVWDVDWRLVEESDGRLRKLAVIDDGIGMTGPEMIALLNRMSSSGKQLGAGRNHGIGAKISGAAVSPHGVIYSSWRDGQGNRVIYHKVAGEERYGLKQVRQAGGGVEDFILPLADADKPYLLAERAHGTQATFLGHHEADDTTQAPAVITEGRQRWLIKALNTRFFRLPEQVAVYVREGNVIRPGAWEPGELTRVHGMEHFLTQRSVARGSVDVDGGLAHWWILDDDPKARARSASEWTSSGHTAALLDDELYEFREPTHGGYERLTAFGVGLARERVVIYVEPTFPIVVANSARTQLKYATRPDHPKQDLPWERWADRFRERMPAEIADLQDELAAQTAGDGKAFIERILKNPRNLRLFQVRRHRPDPRPRAPRRLSHHAQRPAIDGPPARTVAHAAADGQPADPTAAPAHAQTALGPTPAPAHDPGVAATTVHAPAEPPTPDTHTPPTEVEDDRADEQPDDDELERLRQRVSGWIPELRWVSLAARTRPPGDLEDAAARWSRADNTLTINADFRSYRELLEEAIAEYGSSPGAKRVIETTVREIYAQQLVEAVLHARALEGSVRWTADAVDAELLTEGAFTAVAGNRVLMWGYLKKALGQRLGRRRGPRR